MATKKKKSNNRYLFIAVLGFLVFFTSIFLIIPFATRTAEPNFLCGDEICSSGEDEFSCSIDCGLPSAECGNYICEYPETKDTCPIDCNLLHPTPPKTKRCGDEICQTSETAQSCPIDCGTPIARGTVCPFGITNQCFDNALLVPLLNKENRPLVQGTVIHADYTDGFATCTIGAIIQTGGRNYILTAGHCITDGDDFIPDSTDLNRKVEQENSDDHQALNNVIGRVKKWDSTGIHDVALIEINSNVPFSTKSFLDDEINGFTEPKINMEVFKVGRTTGLTFGKVIEINNAEFVIEGNNGEVFGGQGDSGAAIMTVDDPAQIVGILVSGLTDYSNDGGKTSRRVVSPLPQNIINSLNII